MAKTSATSPSSKPKVMVAKKAKTTTTVKASKPAGKKKNHTDTIPKKEQIYRHVCKHYVMGMSEMETLDVALAVGNKNPRSEGFSKAIQELIKEDGLITKGSAKDTLALTEKGINNMPQDLQIDNDDPSKTHDRYIALIQSKVKLGADKVRPLWDIIMDRKPHAIHDIAIQLGYKNPRSFANTKIVQEMKKVGLVESVGKGAIQFTSKVPVVTVV